MSLNDIVSVTIVSTLSTLTRIPRYWIRRAELERQIDNRRKARRLQRKPRNT